MLKLPRPTKKYLTSKRPAFHVRRQTITSVGGNTAKSEASQASLQKQMQDFQDKLRSAEQRERAALLKIKMIGRVLVEVAYCTRCEI
jgi:hypothetical protein